MGYPDVYPANITLDVTGHSLWRRFEAATDDPDPKAGRRVTTWDAGRDGFPDQMEFCRRL